jgi:hypothetical protein
MSGGCVSDVSVSTADTTTSSSSSSSQEAFGRCWDELTQDATEARTSRVVVVAAGPDANRLSDLATGML